MALSGITSTASKEAVPFAGGREKSGDPFFSLPLDETDLANIRSLLSALSQNYFLLLIRGNEIRSTGTLVEQIHPIRFIAAILSRPDLVELLQKIAANGPVYQRFVTGFHNQMSEKAAQEDLTVYAPGFAELVGIDLETVVKILTDKTYEDLIKKNLYK